MCSHPEQVFSCTAVSLFNWKKGFHFSMCFLSTPEQIVKYFHDVKHSGQSSGNGLVSYSVRLSLWAPTAGSSVHAVTRRVEQEESLSEADFS